MDELSILGSIAGAIVLTGFIPQIYKGYRTKKLDDLSYFMLGFLLFGMFLWVVYGINRKDFAIILTNIIGVILNLILISMKFYYSNHSKGGKKMCDDKETDIKKEDKDKIGLWIEPKDVVGALRDIAGKIAEHNGNIRYVEQFERIGKPWLYLEVSGIKNLEILIKELEAMDVVISVKKVPTFNEIFGKRVIIIGGGAQVAAAASGAISEADRHNIRGEKISVDTMPVVGEKQIAESVRAVARLPRAKILILAGALMGGEISEAVEEVKKYGIKVVSLNMAGSVPKHADLVVTDPIQAGVMAVMDIASTAQFSIDRVSGRKF